MTDTSTLNLTRHGADAVPAMRDELLAVHIDARAELLDQPFYSAERFWKRFENYLAGPGFELVNARLNGLLIGYALGSTLSAATRWWNGLQEATDPDLTRETGTRTFAFREILIRKAHQHRGYAHQLHDALLATRPEERATLLVRSDTPARHLYLKWGWKHVGYGVHLF
jgi:GNAT superfamily N-acetyltransferase